MAIPYGTSQGYRASCFKAPQLRSVKEGQLGMDTRVMALFPIRNVVYAGETVIILAFFCNRKRRLV